MICAEKEYESECLTRDYKNKLSNGFQGEIWERPFIKLLQSSKLYTLPYSALELKDKEKLEKGCDVTGP